MIQNFAETLGLAGEGKLFQTLGSYLERLYQIVPITPESSAERLVSCPLIVFCRDNWDPEALQHLNHRCIQLGIAFLPVYTSLNLGMVGPCVLPHTTGCTTCAEQRSFMATLNDAEQNFSHDYVKIVREKTVRQPWLTAWNQEILAQIVLAEIAAYLHAPEQLRTQRAQVCLELDTQESRLHRFLPLSTCPACGHKTPDTPEQATIVLRSQAKPAPYSYHVRDLVANEEALLDTYVDSRLGVISAFAPRHDSAQPHTLAFARTMPQTRQTLISSMGMSTRWNQSMVVALAEMLERLAGHYPHKKQTHVRASYHQLAGTEAVLDPTTLVLHSPAQYARPDFHFVPYHHDLIIDWVWGYSFKRAQPLLVPQTCVYYGGLFHQIEHNAFVYEISNGCALGGNREEAIFHGILEVAERDAFLLTWYAQLALPRLDLTSVTDPSTRLLMKHIEQMSGYTLAAFNATLDHAIPCLWIMAIDEQVLKRPRVLCIAGSHPHPERALMKALQELGTMLLPLVLPDAFEQEKEHLLKMLHDPFEVQQMEDHARLYRLPEAFDRLSFLFRSPQRLSFQEAFPQFYEQPPNRMDLRDDLVALINHYLHHDIDVIVVDQTSPEQDFHDLHCVKVLMPGTLPMTFGHAYRRTTGCQRLLQVPYTLGFRSQPLTEAELNPHPHPFP